MESNFLLLTTLVAFFYGEEDWKIFLCTTILCFFIGLFCKWIGKKKENERFTRADSFLIVSLSWIVFSIIGCIPFIFLTPLDISSSFFETMSGFTTTGATVISDIDGLSHAIKFWRSVMHWMGGLGIVVFSFALVPVYEMKNSNIYSAEVSGIGLDKVRPKIGATARRMLFIYLLFTVICAFMYWIGPMEGFDAICHAMSTIATGGFSTHTASIAYFHSQYIEYVAIFFMLLSSVNFSLYYYLTIRNTSILFKNEELRTFFKIVGFFTIVFILLFYFVPAKNEIAGKLPQGIEETFRTALFHVSAIISSTGFSAQKFDYVAWGSCFWMPTVLIMAIGACAGSTAGGIKIIRLLICIKSVFNEFVLQLHPRAVLGVRINGRIITEERVRRTLSFIFLYCVLIVISTVFFTLLGSDIDTGIGSSISMLSNIGPATGMTGPASNFSGVPTAGKWLMSFYMLIGRLEIFTVLFLFFPSFWKEKN